MEFLFEDLEVWKKASRLAVDIYESLLQCTDYSFRDQIQSSAVSVASNIAEGHERGGKDFARYLRMASGSAAKLRTQLYIATALKILEGRRSEHLMDETKRISKMLYALSKTIEVPRKPNTEN